MTSRFLASAFGNRLRPNPGRLGQRPISDVFRSQISPGGATASASPFDASPWPARQTPSSARLVRRAPSVVALARRRSRAARARCRCRSGATDRGWRGRFGLGSSPLNSGFPGRLRILPAVEILEGCRRTNRRHSARELPPRPLSQILKGKLLAGDVGEPGEQRASRQRHGCRRFWQEEGPKPSSPGRAGDLGDQRGAE